MAATNPYSLGYSLIWTALTNWPAFNIVRLGPNTQINMQAVGYTPQIKAQLGDRPSVKLMEGRYSFHQQRNSKVVELIVDYPVVVASGQFNIDRIGLLNTIIIQALKNAGTNLGNGLLYKWDAVQGVSQQKDKDTSRPEWITATTIRIWFWIPNAEFQNTKYT